MSLMSYHLQIADAVGNVAALGRQAPGAGNPTGRANVASLEALARYLRSLNPTTHGFARLMFACCGEPYKPGQRQAMLLTNIGWHGGIDPEDTGAAAWLLAAGAVEDTLAKLRGDLQGEGTRTSQAADLQQRLEQETGRAEQAEQTVADLRQELVDLQAEVQRHAQAAEILELGATRPAPRRKAPAAA